MLDLAFQSDEARAINKLIFETIYHAALMESNEMAKERAIYFAENPSTHTTTINDNTDIFDLRTCLIQAKETQLDFPVF